MNCIMDPMDFDDPHPETEDLNFGGESSLAQVTGMLAPIKPYIQHIVAAVVILAIVWFAYDYFFASLIEVEITVKNTEGELLSKNSLELFARGSTQPFFSGKNGSTYTVSLKPGRYNFEAKSQGYDTEKGGFDVSQDEKTHVVVLEQGLGVEIIGFKESVPDRMFVGGIAQLSVQLKNNSGQDKEVELVAEKDIEGMVSAGKITVPAGASEIVELELSIPSNTTVNEEKTGDGKEAVLRVKYTNEKESVNFLLFPNPAENISLNTLDLMASARENDNKDEGDITVRNSNKFSVDSLTLKLEITSASKNDREEVLSWLQFSEIANEENPRHMEISSIGGGDSVKKELQLVVPLTAKKELDIKGNIILDAPYFSEPIKKTITIDVQAEAEFGLSLSVSPTSPLEIKWDDTLGKYEDLLISLEAENDGQIDLKNVVLSIENDADCSPDWLEFQENSIELLQVGKTEELKLTASAPIVVRGQESSKQCDIEYRYDDPVQLGEYIEKTEIAFLEVRPEES
jgi:hypothetical protein